MVVTPPRHVVRSCDRSGSLRRPRRRGPAKALSGSDYEASRDCQSTTQSTTGVPSETAGSLSTIGWRWGGTGQDPPRRLPHSSDPFAAGKDYSRVGRPPLLLMHLLLLSISWYSFLFVQIWSSNSEGLVECWTSICRTLQALGLGNAGQSHWGWVADISPLSWLCLAGPCVLHYLFNLFLIN